MREADVQLRYAPVLRFLRKQLRHGERILEVGGGVAGIAQFLDQPVTGCDPYFLKQRGRRADWQGKIPLPNIRPVGGVATKLPFPSKRFPVVVSCDTLEHLPKTQRRKAVLEMVRVSSRYVLLAFPCGAGSAACERWLFAMGKTLMGREHRWLKEHLRYGLPTEHEVIKLLNGLDFRQSGYTNSGMWVLVTIASAIAKPFGWLFYPLARWLNLPPYYRTMVIIKRS